MAQQKILVIVGPTASGKSGLAVRLARKFNGEIISADSRQLYRGLDIGTGKITREEMRGIPHYLLDVANPKKQFSVAQYKLLADKFARYIVRKDKLPIVVGGTGFYIDVLTGTTVFPDVPPNKLLRSKLDKFNKEKLFLMLKKKDPRRASTIDRDNKVRLIRALEIIDILGKVPTRQPARSTSLDFVFIGLKPENLDERIYKRLLKRLEPMIREGTKLHSQGLSYQRMHQLGLEYRYIALYLQGKLSREETIDKLYVKIRRYAKRQMTWFKRNKKIRWFEPSQAKEIEKYVRIELSKGD
ncbi:MAG: tRNA (adenosine(37)-N6)-dimethylallyltransferase MiaA [Candidatus Zambryskibacteria bacterium RIFCSPLOWO2_01_FULL_47_33]|nr:MAG: tRNA (adenosine(37)-N6)-dimethylallyltransferase MiaA [Candidatus Zambryskibacteria bacterium RIFCSPLOWO2_01_FULL_47_33]